MIYFDCVYSFIIQDLSYSFCVLCLKKSLITLSILKFLDNRLYNRIAYLHLKLIFVKLDMNLEKRRM